MKNEGHAFEVSSEELCYLQQIVSNDETLSILLSSPAASYGTRHSVKLSGSQADQLRACLTESLAKIGFGEDYSLTSDGRRLEDLIDRFYIP